MFVGTQKRSILRRLRHCSSKSNFADDDESALFEAVGPSCQKLIQPSWFTRTCKRPLVRVAICPVVFSTLGKCSAHGKVVSTSRISIVQSGALRGLPLEGVGCNEVQPRGRLSPPNAQSLSSILRSAVIRTRTELVPHGSIQTVPNSSFIIRRLLFFVNCKRKSKKMHKF